MKGNIGKEEKRKNSWKEVSLEGRTQRNKGRKNRRKVRGEEGKKIPEEESKEGHAECEPLESG